MPVPPALFSFPSEKTPAPGASPCLARFPGPPRLLGAGTAPGAGEEAIVGGEEGGKGEATGCCPSAPALSGLENRGSWLESVEVAIASARGGSFKRTIRVMCDRELRRESVGEEGSGSI